MLAEPSSPCSLIVAAVNPSNTSKGNNGLSSTHEKGHQTLTAPLAWKLEVIDGPFISIQKTC